MSSATSLRKALLESATCQELQRCSREVCFKVPAAGHRKVDLIASIDKCCQNPNTHEQVCRHLLRDMTLPRLKNWLSRQLLHGQRLRVTQMGRSKTAIVARFVQLAMMPALLSTTQGSQQALHQMAEPCQPNQQGKSGGEPRSSTDQAAPQEHCAGAGLQLVAVGTRADPLNLQARLAHRWVRKLRKFRKRSVKEQSKIQKVEARRALSQKVIKTLRKTMQTCGNAVIGDIRACVSAEVGVPLDRGHRRLFFDRCLAKFLKPPQRRRRRRKGGIELGNALVAKKSTKP